MKLRPLHDRVVIERIDAEAKTAGGIIIPDTAQEKPQQGKVIAVGPGGRDENGKPSPSTSGSVSASCSANGLTPRSRSMDASTSS
jgi:co-chaperonin GroES (HSP10)